MHASLTKLVGVFLVGFVALGLLMIAAGAGSASGSDSESISAYVSVESVQVDSSYNFRQLAVGKVEPQQTSMLSFDRSGQINALFVEEGGFVSKGQVLASLEQSRLDAQISKAESAVERARAEANLAEVTKNRIAELVAKGLDSSQSLDEAKARQDVARAVYAQAQSALEALFVEQQKSSIYAPYDGFVVKRLHDIGAVVRGGEPVFTLKTNTAPEIRVALSKKLASQVSVGDQVEVEQKPFTAELVRFVQQQDTRTRTQDVIFVANTQAWQPLDGEIVNLVFNLTIEDEGIWIPISALSSGIRGMWTVYAVNASNIIESRMVSLLHTDGEKAYVSGALQSGDKIVSGGTHKLVPGQRVQIAKD